MRELGARTGEERNAIARAAHAGRARRRACRGGAQVGTPNGGAVGRAGAARVDQCGLGHAAPGEHLREHAAADLGRGQLHVVARARARQSSARVCGVGTVQAWTEAPKQCLLLRARWDAGVSGSQHAVSSGVHQRKDTAELESELRANVEEARRVRHEHEQAEVRVTLREASCRLWAG